MSDIYETPESTTRSFTMRLTPEDQAVLAKLCDLYGLDRPASIRRAIRFALKYRAPLASSGYFVSAGAGTPACFPVRLQRKETHE